MVIRNGCVTLRAVEESYFDLLFYYVNAPEIESMAEGFYLPISSSEQKKWLQNYTNILSDIRLMIELNNGNTIGMIMLNDIDLVNGSASISYKISMTPRDRIRGDVQDAIEGMLGFVFGWEVIAAGGKEQTGLEESARQVLSPDCCTYFCCIGRNNALGKESRVGGRFLINTLYTVKMSWENLDLPPYLSAVGCAKMMLEG